MTGEEAAKLVSTPILLAELKSRGSMEATWPLESLKAQLKMRGVFTMYGTLKELSETNLPMNLDGEDLMFVIVKIEKQCDAWYSTNPPSEYPKNICQKNRRHDGEHADHAGVWG